MADRQHQRPGQPARRRAGSGRNQRRPHPAPVPAPRQDTITGTAATQPHPPRTAAQVHRATAHDHLQLRQSGQQQRILTPPPRLGTSILADLETAREANQPIFLSSEKAPTSPVRTPMGTAAPRPADATRYSPQNLVPLPPGATSGTVRRPSPQSLPGDHGEGRCHRLHGHGDAVHQPASREPPESPRTTPLTTQTRPAVDTYNVVRHHTGVEKL